MRVLHLAPPRTRPDRITAHTFIDEEIDAIRRAGVECLTLPDRIDASRAGAIAFAARHAVDVPLVTLRDVRETLHAVRIEYAAAQLIRDCRVDVVHSHFGWPAGFGGLLAASETGVPLVASIRGMDILTSPAIRYGLRLNPQYDAAVKTLLRRADRTLYATRYMRDRGIALGAPDDRAILIRKGVDLARFHPAEDRAAAQRALGINGPMVLAVGSLSPRKGLIRIVNALSTLQDLAWTFVICGDGPERESLQQWATTLGIGDRVRFAGNVDRGTIGGYFGAADVFVHAALMEAAGNVILEALASGCPVVCTDSGGPAEYVVDGTTGFVVDGDDDGALGNRLRLVLGCASLRARLSRCAREFAEQHLAYARMIRDYITTYDAVVA
ncbi:MAG TPA: glycosyltransferase family 4 protein [Vicinamibacterales bacterium]|nr:glycosyltransferase family 4 protein [Vicinamibacterales bacterium]